MDPVLESGWGLCPSVFLPKSPPSDSGLTAPPNTELVLETASAPPPNTEEAPGVDNLVNIPELLGVSELDVE